MGRPGFEPETSRLKAECSTAELATRIDFVTLVNIAQSMAEFQTKLQNFWLKFVLIGSIESLFHRKY